MFYNSIKTANDFVVDEIGSEKSDRTIEAFTTYDEVDLSFDELKEVIDNHYSDYYNVFSVVKGIYMIIDRNTGKQYVGSAYGEGGIWGRWISYANTYHSNNTELKVLFDKNHEVYFKKFKYIIL